MKNIALLFSDGFERSCSVEAFTREYLCGCPLETDQISDDCTKCMVKRNLNALDIFAHFEAEFLTYIISVVHTSVVFDSDTLGEPSSSGSELKAYHIFRLDSSFDLMHCFE
jgi:hypothetical protein